MATFEELCQDIWDVEARIEEHATMLRSELEELSELARKLWESDEDYNLPDGQKKDHDDLQDMADDISEIEQMFNKD